ncbi:hypothetical protein Tco_1242291 [Tanacetum coccineum]
MTTLQFADTHNLVAFLSKPAESDGFEQIATIKVKTVNGEVQLQALVDGKKIIVTEASVRRDLQLNNEEGILSPQWKSLTHTIFQCLSAKTTAWNEFSSTMASAIIYLATNQKFNFSKYIFESMVKNLDNAGKFLMYPRFLQVFLDKQLEGMQSYNRIYGEGLEMPTDPHHTPTLIQPSTSQPLLKQRSKRPKRKDIEVPRPSGLTTNVADEAVYEEMDDSCSPRRQETIWDTIAQTGFENVSKTSNDSLVIDMENTKTAQAQEITSLKLSVKKLEKKRGSRTHKLKRLYKVGRSARVISYDEASLGDQEDASKQGRKINDIDKDADITLVHETQGRYDDEEMFITCVLDGDDVLAESEVTIKDVNLSVNEVTLVQALAVLKSAKVQEKSNVVEEPSQGTRQRQRDYGKKELIRLEELAFKLQAKEEEEETLPKEKAQREEEANIVSWDNVQAMIDADYQMAQQMQAKEQEELSIEKKSKSTLRSKKKYFAAIRAQEKRNKPPTKAQKRNTMSTYLKNMAGYKNNHSKRAGTELEQESIKKQKLDEDKETTELQKLIEVVLDKEEVAIDAIPLATKPPSIVDYKIHKERKKTYY